MVHDTYPGTPPAALAHDKETTVTRADIILRERRAGLTLLEIAKRHGTTTERVWQILRRGTTYGW